jgi:hypothetical protein
MPVGSALRIRAEPEGLRAYPAPGPEKRLSRSGAGAGLWLMRKAVPYRVISIASKMS